MNVPSIYNKVILVFQSEDEDGEKMDTEETSVLPEVEFPVD